MKIDLLQIALDAYSSSLCRIDLDLHMDRENWKNDDDSRTQQMTSYFQSSSYKNAFCRLMGLSRYVKQPSTVAYISKRIVVSRTAAHGFVKDCLKQEWITAVQLPNKSVGYWGSDVLINELEIHARYVLNLVEKHNVNADGDFYKMAVERKAALYFQTEKNVLTLDQEKTNATT